MTESPRDQLARGVEILAPALEQHGFVYAPSHAGVGSGGHFASGNFTRNSRKLSLHHRWGLGIVTFGVEEFVSPHADYVSFLGVGDRSTLLWMPLASGLDRYHALRFDIETLFGDFTTGDASMLTAAARKYAPRMAIVGIQLNAEAVGDIEKRRLARDAFNDRHCAEAIELLDSIVYPELLTGSETRMLEIARSRNAGTEQHSERERE